MSTIEPLKSYTPDAASFQAAATTPPDPRPLVVAVEVPQRTTTPRITTRIESLNRRIDAAPLVLPRPGQTRAPSLPSVLSEQLGSPQRTWRGIEAGSRLSDKAVVAEVSRFMRDSGLARGLPAHWSAAQRDRFASLVVASALDTERSGRSVTELRRDLEAAYALVEQQAVRLPDMAQSPLNAGVDTRPLGTLPTQAANDTAAPSAAQQLNASIVNGEIAQALASVDGEASRKAYEAAYQQVRQLPQGEQRVVAQNLDRQYLAYVGQREAALQQQAQAERYTQIVGQWQALPPQAQQPLRPAAEKQLALGNDLALLQTARQMLRNDTAQPPLLASLDVTLSTGRATVNRATIGDAIARTESQLATAQQAWGTAVASAQQAAGSTVQPPKPAAAADKAAGRLSNALGANVNFMLRDIAAEQAAGTLKAKPYDNAVDAGIVKGEVQSILVSRGGVAADRAARAADNVMQIAQRMDIDPVRLANELTRRVADARALVARVTPQNPLVVDGRSPKSIEEAKQYFRALYSLGERVPPRSVEVDGKTVDVSEVLYTTYGMTDLDGVLAGSYGEFGLEVAVQLKDGRRAEVYLPLGQALAGAPTEIVGLWFRPGRAEAVVDLKVRKGESNELVSQRVTVPLTAEQAKLLAGATNATAQAVEGLTARFFPAQAMQLLRAVSDQNGRGAMFPGGVLSNQLDGNTFGTAGQDPASGQYRPGELTRSLGRSEPGGITLLPVGRGFPYLPNFRVYSGGAAVTEGDVIQQPFGLDPKDAAAILAVASKLDGIVTELGAKYGLSPEQIADWRKLNFTNADIPSIILPKSVVDGLAQRGADAGGRGLADLQRDIETRVQQLIRDNGIGDKYRIHHTPSQGDDEVALARFDAAGKLSGKFTTEWQINVKGGKALPVLDALANRLQKHHGIDLLAQLRAAGYDYQVIRRMELPEVMDFFRNVVRPLIDRQEAALGRKLTGRIVIQVDTYSESVDASGKRQRGGSDMSLIDAARALYGDANVTIVQVDTAGGKPMVGRQPAFETRLDPQTGKPVLVRPSVDPNGDGPVTVYVVKPSDLAEVLYDAFRSQFPLFGASSAATPQVPGSGEKKTR